MDLSKIGSHGLEDIISGMAPQVQQQQVAPPQQQQAVDPLQGLYQAQLPQQGLDMSGTQPTMAQQDPRGMFGIHGTARNILGMLGDAFLVQSGNKPVFAPQLQRERESQALQGMVDDPANAAQRLSQVNPEAGQDFYIKASDAKRREQTSDEQYNGLILGRAMSLIGTGNADNWPAVRARALDYAKSKGVPIPDLPQTYDPEAIRAAMLSAVSPEKQMYYDLAGKKFDANQEYRGQRLEQGARGLDIRGEAVDETERHNHATENLGVDSLDERGRYHGDIVALGQGNLDERGSHNRATEHQADVNERKGITGRGLNGDGDITVVTRDGTVQPMHGLKPIGGKGRRNFGGRPGAPAAGRVIDVKTRAEADALPPGSIFRTPTGQILRK